MLNLVHLRRLPTLEAPPGIVHGKAQDRQPSRPRGIGLEPAACQPECLLGRRQSVSGEPISQGCLIVAVRAARRLGADHRAARRPQGGMVDREVLIEGGDLGIAVEGHRRRDCLADF
jgi:hypothetical protein